MPRALPGRPLLKSRQPASRHALECPPWRVLLALGLITFVAVLTYLGRDGYVDPEDDSVSLLDAFYYSTVSITTTGMATSGP